MSPGPTPPKKSPIMLPIAEPQAAAGPNRNEHTTGIALPGRTSVTPGISGSTLKGINTAAYSAADSTHNTTIRVLRHMARNSCECCCATVVVAPCQAAAAAGSGTTTSWVGLLIAMFILPLTSITVQHQGAAS